MPRAIRLSFDGAVYHVYNHLARGERAFTSDDMASKFAESLREVTIRDGVTVFAWVVLPTVDVDEVLRIFGGTRRRAWAAYTRTIRGAGDATWIGEAPGHLPWWRLGRPRRREGEEPEVTGRAKREADSRRQMLERPTLAVEAFVERVAATIGIGLEDLRGRGKGRELKPWIATCAIDQEEKVRYMYPALSSFPGKDGRPRQER
jgi:hypothetical protein